MKKYFALLLATSLLTACGPSAKVDQSDELGKIKNRQRDGTDPGGGAPDFDLRAFCNSNIGLMVKNETVCKYKKDPKEFKSPDRVTGIYTVPAGVITKGMIIETRGGIPGVTYLHADIDGRGSDRYLAINGDKVESVKFPYGSATLTLVANYEFKDKPVFITPYECVGEENRAKVVVECPY